MNVRFVAVGTNEKGVSAFQKTCGQLTALIAELISLLWRNLTGVERLTYLISNYIAFLLSAGDGDVVILRKL